MSINLTKTNNITSQNQITDKSNEDSESSINTSNAQDRISRLRDNLGLGTYNDIDTNTDLSLLTSTTATNTNKVSQEGKSVNNSTQGLSPIIVEEDTPPPPAALAFWDNFYQRGSYSEDWIHKALDDYNERKYGGDVIVIGGHAGHSLGDLIGDAGGIAGLDNGMRSANRNTENDALFKSVYDKMSAEDKERLATTPLVVDVSTGRILGEYEERGQSWGDAAHNGSTPNNSIEGTTINIGGKSHKVAESTFRWSSPIILDMDGDGIELTSNEDGTVFDIDGDGKQDKTSWTKSGQGFDDAFLVLDKNKNGEIDSGKELFGDQNGSANGYDELAKLDSNKDGTIDAKDAAYKELQVWADLDGDGKVGNGELKSLEETGVTSISTQNTGTVGDKQDQHGNDISLESTFTRVVDGEEKTLKTVDAFFTMRSLNGDANSTRSTSTNNASISPDEINATSAEDEAELNAEKQAERFRKSSLSSKLDEAEANKQAYESELSSVESEVNNATSKSSTVKITKPASSEDEETEAVDVSSSEDDTVVLSRKDSLTADISSIDSEIENLRSQIE
jgi:hypothetical protein